MRFPTVPKDPLQSPCAIAATLTMSLIVVVQASEDSIAPIVAGVKERSGDRRSRQVSSSALINEIAGPNEHKSYLTIPPSPALLCMPAAWLITHHPLAAA